jgi:hypothetical protein
VAGPGEDCGGARPGQSRERKGEEGRRRGLTGGTGVSVADRKQKRPADRRAAVGKGGVGRWAAGPKGKEVSPFLSFFQTLFKSNLFNSNSNKTFQTFSQSFINFLNLTQATKTMHSQIMMHKHLLSLD